MGHAWNVSWTDSEWPDEWPDGPIPDTWSARMQLREEIESTGDPLAEWDSTDPTGLPCGVSGGAITIGADAETTAAWAWRKAKWDLEVVSPTGVVVRLDWGTVILKPEVTR